VLGSIRDVTDNRLNIREIAKFTKKMARKNFGFRLYGPSRQDGVDI